MDTVVLSNIVGMESCGGRGGRESCGEAVGIESIGVSLGMLSVAVVSVGVLTMTESVVVPVVTGSFGIISVFEQATKKTIVERTIDRLTMVSLLLLFIFFGV